MTALLTLRDLHGGYGREEILQGISLTVEKGEFFGVIGPNGCGKSTLLRVLGRVIRPSRGAVYFEDRDIARLGLKEFSKKVASVPQDTLINFSFTVEEIVLMGRIPHLARLQAEGRHDFEVARRALALTDSAHLRDKRINALSAGERQRVIIATALAQEPVLLFLDEPTSHLDIGHQIQILDLLTKLNRENGLTVVIVLHDLNLASEYCTRIALLSEGKVFKEGKPGEVLTYRAIEEVYKTIVIVNQNPVSSKPHVMVVPQGAAR